MIQRRVGLGILFLCMILGWPRQVVAQAQDPVPYWTTTIDGLPTHWLTADLDNDTIAEIILVFQDGNNATIQIFDAAGVLQTENTLSGTVRGLKSTNILPTNPQSEIILLLNNSLILLDHKANPIGEDSTTSYQQIFSSPEGQRIIQIETLAQIGILIRLNDGTLHLINGQGQSIWGTPYQDKNISIVPNATLLVSKNNESTSAQAIFSYSIKTAREDESRFVMLDETGAVEWGANVSGTITDLNTVTWQDNTHHIAVGTSEGLIIGFDTLSRDIEWQTDLTAPIVSITSVTTATQTLLLVETQAHQLITINRVGDIVWQTDFSGLNLPLSPFSISPNPTTSDPKNSATAALAIRREATAHFIIDGQSGCPLRSGVATGFSLEVKNAFTNNDCNMGRASMPTVPSAERVELIDINQDNQPEILTQSADTLSLYPLGQVAYQNSWSFSLNASPTAILKANIDDTLGDELILGTRDGRLAWLANNGSVLRVERFGEKIDDLHLLDSTFVKPKQVAILYEGDQDIIESAQLACNTELSKLVLDRTQDGDTLPFEVDSRQVIEAITVDSGRLWKQPIKMPARVTAKTVGNIDGTGHDSLLIGTRAGQLFNITPDGRVSWCTLFTQPIEHIVNLPLYNRSDGSRILVFTANNVLYQLNKQGDLLDEIDIDLIPASGISDTFTTPTRRFTAAVEQIQIINSVRSRDANNELSQIAIVFLENGNALGFTLNTQDELQQIWEVDLGDTKVTALIPRTNFLNIASEDGNIYFLNALNGDLATLVNLPPNTRVSAFNVGNYDLNLNLVDVAVTNDAPQINLFASSGRLLETIATSNPITYLQSERRFDNEPDQLLAISQRGLTQKFAASEQIPPLFVSPKQDISDEAVVFSVMQLGKPQQTDIFLELFDPVDGWVTQNTLPEIRSSVYHWQVDRTDFSSNVAYRFRYDNGRYSGIVGETNDPTTISPAVVPPAIDQRPLLGILLGAIIGTALVTRYFNRRQAQPSDRIYKRIVELPENTLIELDQLYSRNNNASNLMLDLANSARAGGNRPLSNLADALYLLRERPDTSVSIINDLFANEPNWTNVDIWEETYSTAKSLLNANSLNQLSLLLPNLNHLIASQKEAGRFYKPTEQLLPILATIRDAQRVDLPEDKLAYFAQANTLLTRLHTNLPLASRHIDRDLLQAIASRWQGWVRAEIESVRGRPFLEATLKTKRILAEGKADLLIDVKNNGRSAAESVQLVLDDDPAYVIHGNFPQIAALPRGKSQTLSVQIEPLVTDRFRVPLTILYEDPNGRSHTVEFGDMVELIKKPRTFSPIPNRYSPGMPLRNNNPMFVGRESQFKFISDNAQRLAQESVLIMVGQRRTGKTSFLLRLDQHLPNTLIPIYVDCQSLGTVPGLGAFFNELAYLISDTLALKDIHIDIPDDDAWDANPGRKFTQEFLPSIRSTLPNNETLIFVFDEFEAFENLVKDGILPPTFFPFMRHMMQHAQGISFIFVGTRRLEEMTADYWNVLFNIALYRKIGFLDQTSAYKLINEPVAPNLIYDDLALAKIWRVTAGHPYFLQLVCYTLVKRANEKQLTYITISDVNEELSAMMRLGEVHFAYIWQQSSDIERALLLILAHDMENEPALSLPSFVTKLETYDVRYTSQQVLAALNVLIERDILQETILGSGSQYKLQIGLVGTWVAENKNLNSLFNKAQK